MPLVQSFEPGENWFWDYTTDAYYDGPPLAAPDQHPADQPVPGPAGRVPGRLAAATALTGDRHEQGVRCRPQDPSTLNNHHRDTLLQIFQHPTSHNIEWHAVLSLLEVAGSVEQRHDGKYVVRVGDEQVVLVRPKHKDVDVQQVVDLRRMLTSAGYDAVVETLQDGGPEGLTNSRLSPIATVLRWPLRSQCSSMSAASSSCPTTSGSSGRSR